MRLRPEAKQKASEERFLLTAFGGLVQSHVAKQLFLAQARAHIAKPKNL